MSATLDKSVRMALRALVRAVDGLPAKAGFENVEFTPKADEEWRQEARLAPMPRQLIDMGGAVNHLKAEFLYEVHFGAPKLTGPERLEEFAGLLLSALKPGTTFTVEGTPARITSAQRSNILFPDERPEHAVVACTFLIVLLPLNT